MTMPENLTLQQAQELTKVDGDSRQHRERVVFRPRGGR